MSNACFSGSSSDALPSAALIPPSAAPEWLRIGWIFEMSADVRARVERLDRGAHAGAAGADDEHVVLRLHRQRTLSKRLGGSASDAGAAGRGDGLVRVRELLEVLAEHPRELAAPCAS